MPTKKTLNVGIVSIVCTDINKEIHLLYRCAILAEIVGPLVRFGGEGDCRFISSFGGGTELNDKVLKLYRWGTESVQDYTLPMVGLSFFESCMPPSPAA